MAAPSWVRDIPSTAPPFELEALNSEFRALYHGLAAAQSTPHRMWEDVFAPVSRKLVEKEFYTELAQ